MYEEGEWWVFKVKRKDKPREEYSVIYKNRNFESNHPDFLKVSEDRGSISWLPLISVHTEGPKKRWFDFPLVPGKEWNFHYDHTAARRFVNAARGVINAKRGWRFVETEVKGPVTIPVETPAGKFPVTEIRQTIEVPERVSGEDYKLNYFYSPTTKSAVKLVVDGAARINPDKEIECSYTMELVGFGDRNSLPSPEAKLRNVTNLSRRK